MDPHELIWNLKRLIRDAFPKGLPVADLESQYRKYFQNQQPLPSPSSIEAGCTGWPSLLRSSAHFRKWFKLDRSGRKIKVLPIPEGDLKAYFRYMQYVAARQGAKVDGWSDLSESEGEDNLVAVDMEDCEESLVSVRDVHSRPQGSAEVQQSTSDGITGNGTRTSAQMVSIPQIAMGNSARIASTSTSTSSLPPSAPDPKKPEIKPTSAKTPQIEGTLEIEAAYRSSEWLSELMPKKPPYFPQLGDDLIYFTRGHQLYIEEVRKKGLRPFTLEDFSILSWRSWLGSSPQAEVRVRVVEINFEIRPPRLCSLKLAIADRETGELNGNYLPGVTYHEVPNITDFLVLKQVYDKGMERHWAVGDRFRCLVDRLWLIGSITAVKANDSTFPESKFLCYTAKWANGDVEKMSPWDIEIIPSDFEIPYYGPKTEGIPASQKDLEEFLYFKGTASDWPPVGDQARECDRIAALLDQIMLTPAAENFVEAVNLKIYPEYVYALAYPMDLSTICSRLRNRFYRRLDALKFDIQQIALNANAERVNQQPRMPIPIVKNAEPVIITELGLQSPSQAR